MRSLASSLALLGKIDKMVGFVQGLLGNLHLSTARARSVEERDDCTHEAASRYLKLSLSTGGVRIRQADCADLAESKRLIEHTLARIFADGVVRDERWRRCVRRLPDAACRYAVWLRVDGLIVVSRGGKQGGAGDPALKRCRLLFRSGSSKCRLIRSSSRDRLFKRQRLRRTVLDRLYSLRPTVAGARERHHRHHSGDGSKPRKPHLWKIRCHA